MRPANGPRLIVGVPPQPSGDCFRVAETMLTAFRVRKRLLDELEQPVGKVARKETAEEAHVSPAVPPPADVEPLAQPSAAPGDAALSSLGVRTPPGKTPPVRVETVIKARRRTRLLGRGHCHKAGDNGQQRV